METARKCDGQCQNCSLMQQTYCSAVRLHSFMEHEPVLFEKIDSLERAVAALTKRLDSGGLIIAQGGGGAEKASEESTN
ncbi:MAG: hypothetical protein II636_04180 [Bacteroidales bacterium]|nr:hypothetical protein [Bacteroidales bacterium]